MVESEGYIEETIGLIPKIGCPRQERVLLNAFFVRPRIRKLSNYGLIVVAFSRPNQHLLSFYELFSRLISRKIELKDLLILMQVLRDTRETRKIGSMYWWALEELKRQIRCGEPVKIVEDVSACKEYNLSRKIILEIEETLAERSDGMEIGNQLFSVVSGLDLDYLARVCPFGKKPARPS
jgi:hypothetical protein